MLSIHAGAYILSALEESGRDPAEVSVDTRNFPDFYQTSMLMIVV
jgi:hypothetical protein